MIGTHAGSVRPSGDEHRSVVRIMVTSRGNDSIPSKDAGSSAIALSARKRRVRQGLEGAPHLLARPILFDRSFLPRFDQGVKPPRDAPSGPAPDRWAAALERLRGARRLTVVLGLLYTSAVLWVTLRPTPWATDGDEERLGILNSAAWSDPGSWIEGRPLEIALNVAMFLPIGVITAVLLRGSARLLVPLALTLTIELLQIPLDRISHPRDLVANALGAVLGVALAAMAERRAGRDTSRRMSPVAAGAAEG